MRSPRVRRTPKVWAIQGKHVLPEPARLQLTRGAHGFRVGDPEVYRVLNAWLSPLGVSVDACSEVAATTLRANLVLADLVCPKCRTPHLYNYDLAIRGHTVHTCLSCGADWR